MLARLKKLASLAERPRPPVGTTPHDVVWRENKWRLLRYTPRPEGLAFRSPVLLVPSLINRHYVLDLLPHKSLVGWMVARGHDVYCVDWGTPGPEDRYVSFADVADRWVGRAVRRATRLSGARPHLLGYCMGGTLGVVYASLHPDAVQTLTALAAPVSFADDGPLATWTRTKGFDVDALVDATGLVPWQLLQGAFNMLRPTLPLTKAVALIDRAWDDRFLDGFLAIETWANDNVSLPGDFYRTWIGDLYRGDALMNDTFTVGGQPALLSAITTPTLAVAFEQDTIVPVESCCDALAGRVGSDDFQALRLPGSHIGGTTSSAASKALWPALAGFWESHDAADG